jgi:N-acetylglutamate synthase-like GNAT family acetyltransferase
VKRAIAIRDAELHEIPLLEALQPRASVVAPRAGVGTALIADVVAHARAHGVGQIDVVANPTAVGFYTKVGFIRGDNAMTQFGPAFLTRMTLTSEASTTSHGRNC